VRSTGSMHAILVLRIYSMDIIKNVIKRFLYGGIHYLRKIIISVIVFSAIITGCHRLVGLNNRHLFLIVLEAGKSKIRVPAR